MPREIIAGSADFKIEVVWRRGLYAQLAVRGCHSTLAEVVAGGVGDEPETFDGLWADLDVERIDNLMKVLRRARKQLVEMPDRDADEAYKPLL